MSAIDPPDRLSETAVKVAVALTGAIPVVGSLVNGVGGAAVIIFEDVRARRYAKAAALIDDVVYASGGSDALGARLCEDEQLEATFVAAVEAALRTGMEAKRRLLTRAVAQAVEDAAKVDDAQLMVDTLSQLDVPHIQALQRLAAEYYEHLKDTSKNPFGVSEAWKAEPAAIRAALLRVGAAKLHAGTYFSGEGRPLQDGISDYGLEILRSLREVADA